MELTHGIYDAESVRTLMSFEVLQLSPIKCGHCDKVHDHEYSDITDDLGIPEEPYCYSCDEPLCDQCIATAVPPRSDHECLKYELALLKYG